MELIKKIIFLKGNLLDPLSKINGFKKINENSLVITANLPYLSKKIYSSAPVDVKKYEPKSALYSPKEGLQHYGKLLLQLKNFITNLQLTSVICLFEISPEQKQTFNKIIKTVFPNAKINFKKDLAGKWRLCKINPSFEK
jgi:methylase of polypeptide subunit release factors